MYYSSRSEFFAAHTKEVRDLRHHLHELEMTREQALKEVNELQLQTRLAEEARDLSRAELHETVLRLKDMEEIRDTNRRDITELKRRIAELERERSTLETSNSDLRRQLKERRVKGIRKLVPPEAVGGCLVVVALCELVLGASPCLLDQSLLSFRMSCDGHRQSRAPCLTIIHEKHEGKNGGRLQAYFLFIAQFGPLN
ncbi:unnamed protein product [Protopolystoma xenopodis]|uniref:Uncharacterized protein n=1 Tax=Protopolystoma xenopodis TaxID=117903 RepID=A0A448XJR5_9PLAT|nr:unnamed protein product [Protopolystoma xenopodis]